MPISAVDIHVGNAATLCQLGDMYEAKRKEMNVAETFYRAAIEIDPACADAHFKLGSLLRIVVPWLRQGRLAAPQGAHAVRRVPVRRDGVLGQNAGPL